MCQCAKGRRDPQRATFREPTSVTERMQICDGMGRFFALHVVTAARVGSVIARRGGLGLPRGGTWRAGERRGGPCLASRHDDNVGGLRLRFETSSRAPCFWCFVWCAAEMIMEGAG